MCKMFVQVSIYCRQMIEQVKEAVCIFNKTSVIVASGLISYDNISKKQIKKTDKCDAYSVKSQGSVGWAPILMNYLLVLIIPQAIDARQRLERWAFSDRFRLCIYQERSTWHFNNVIKSAKWPYCWNIA